jgi:hypothetical protein
MWKHDDKMVVSEKSSIQIKKEESKIEETEEEESE